MATRPQEVHSEGMGQPGAAPTKAKRKRSPSVAKPAFFVIQIVDDAGNPVPFDKRRVKLVRVERNAEVVMEMMDNPEFPNAFYLRGIVPVTRATGQRPAAVAQPAAAA